jgi:hypothetical protein
VRETEGKERDRKEKDREKRKVKREIEKRMTETESGADNVSLNPEKKQNASGHHRVIGCHCMHALKTKVKQ